MAIKPVTFQASKNFKSNLYALEVKSRFGNQTNADGYYKGYGNELDATVVGNTITIKKGAFLIQGRMAELTLDQDITISPYTEGLVGYIVARAETYHTDDEDNVSLIYYLSSSLENINLTQEDIYASASEQTNMIYELPIYSFRLSGSGIVDLVKLIQPIQEIENMMSNVVLAQQSASQAQQSASSAEASATEALRLVEQAVLAGGTVVKRNNIPLEELEISGIEGDISNMQGDITTIENDITDLQTQVNSKKVYQHNISFNARDIDNSNLMASLLIQITNNNATLINTYSLLSNFLSQNGFIVRPYGLGVRPHTCNGDVSESNTVYPLCSGLYYDTNENRIYFRYIKNGTAFYFKFNSASNMDDNSRQII